MAQAPGFANTAPSPIPGGYGNPTGAQTHAQGPVPLGLPSASPTGIPQAYGSAPVGSVPTVPPSTGGFLANGTPAGPNTIDPSLAKLSSGGGVNPGMLKQLQNDYGKGVGQQIYDMLSKGMFNPQVAKAMIDAMQPNINRGRSAVESAFGAAGARFSSAAAIGVGDYESQAVLGENQVLANMYQNAQTEQLNLLENILPTVHQEQADSQSSSWLGDLMGGLEIAAGAALIPFSGGLSAPLMGLGVKTLTGANTKSAGVSPTGSPIPMTVPTSTPSTGPYNGGSSSPVDWAAFMQQDKLAASGANAVGGPTNQDTGNPMMDQLMEAMMQGSQVS